MSHELIDQALEALHTLDDMEVGDHRQVYEQIHQQLRRQLDSEEPSNS